MEELNKLAKELHNARREEDAAKKKRIAAEEAILVLVETGENASKTVDAGDGLKLTVKRSISISADVGAIRSMEIPEEVMPIKMTDPVPAGYVFDPKAYASLRETHPDVFLKIAQYVTTNALKASVTLKLA